MPKRRPKPSAPRANIVSLAEAREARRLDAYKERLDRVLKSNKRSIGRLYSTGAIFTKQGCRAGRDLLLAHEHLLRVVTLIARLSDAGDVPAPSGPKELANIFSELDVLLEQTAQLTQQTGELLESLKKE